MNYVQSLTAGVAWLICTVSFPLTVCAQPGSEAENTEVVWEDWGEIPPFETGNTGAFIGVHNDVIVVAGGAELSTTAISAADTEALGGYRSGVWIARRAQKAPAVTRAGGDLIGPALEWQKTTAELRGPRAFGASASNQLGLFAIGGSASTDPTTPVELIRWDARAGSASVLALPPIPYQTENVAAAIVGDVLYVVANTGTFSFDLSVIERDEVGNVLAVGDAIRIRSIEAGGAASAAGPWQLRPRFPDSTGNTPLLAVAQNDGRVDQLFAIERNTHNVWTLHNRNDATTAVWTRKQAISPPGKVPELASGAAMALGQSHILVMADDTYSYNTVTDAWAHYDSTRSTNQSEKRITTRMSATAVQLGDDSLILESGFSATGPESQVRKFAIRGPHAIFGWVNMTIVVAYLFAMVVIGAYFVFKNKNTNDYFRGGQHVPWWAAACSIYATMLSSLTFLGLPALVYRTDWLLYIGGLTILIVAPIAAHVAMPFFRRIDATSAYEYLSKRFNMPVRLFASGLFTLFHIGRMGIVLALTALALAAVTPLDPWQSVVIMGALSVIYCSLGGVEAVIWTDTIQAAVLLVGAVLCFATIIVGSDGGMAGFLATGIANEKFRMASFDFGPESMMTLSIWVVILGGIGQNIPSYVADQAVVQRYIVTRNSQDASKAIWTNAFLEVPALMLFFFIGTGLYYFYQSNPGRLDPTAQIDQILPNFISMELHVGVAGLLVAAIFAAAQSTVSSSMNSIATTVVTDFVRPFWSESNDRLYLWQARALTVLAGILGTCVGMMFLKPEIRSLMEEYFKVIGMFMGALGGLFLLGMMTRRANGVGASVGILGGVAITIVVWLTGWADGYLFGMIGVLSCITIGFCASLLSPHVQPNAEGLTIYTLKGGGSSATK